MIVKNMLLFINFLALLAGIILIGGGSYLHATSGRQGDLGSSLLEHYINGSTVNWIAGLAIAAVVIGVVVTVVSFLGCFGAANEKGMLLKTYFAMLCILVVLELGVGIAAYVKRDTVTTIIENQWTAAATSNSTSLQESIMSVQRYFQCCGFKSIDSYAIPANCAAVNGWPRPCYNSVVESLQQSISTIGGCGVAMGVIELVGIIFSLILFIKIAQRDRASQSLLNEGVLAVANRLKLNVAFEPLEGKTVEVSGPASIGSDKSITVTGINPVLRYLCRIDPESAKVLGATDALKMTQIDHWLDFCHDNLNPDAGFKPLANAFSTLDSHLRLRSFLVGYSVSLADLACWGALKAIPIFNKQLKSGGDVGSYVSRWFNYLESLEFVLSAVADVEKAKVTANKARTDQGSFEIGLKDAKVGEVVTRFPPEPSGYLHIGHAKAALLNEYFARRYEGKMIVRFDDTNPSKEKEEFQESIKEDLSLIGIKPDIVSHTSDHFDKLYDLAIVLIKKGLAYCDDSTQEQMRAERMECIESKCRNLPIEENLRRFAEMTKASEEGLRTCLRAKINMKDKNGAMRDPVIYRCNLEPHHRTGTKWKVYPTYDFACPAVDSIEGVTHALRTIEYRDRNPQYEWFLKALDLRWVHIWDFSRISFVYTVLSKRKLRWFTERGLVSGWDDPRFPTVRGIRRRGMTIQALREYILMQGASQRTLELEWDKIWALNKKIIDPIAPRHVAINREKITKVTVETGDYFQAYAKEVPKHKKNPDVGLKTTLYSSEFYIEFADAKDIEIGEEVTLMDWGNVIVKSIDWNSDRSFIGEIVVKLNLEGDFKKTKKKLTWLARGIPEDRQDLTPIRLQLLDYDYLITKKKLEEDDRIEDFVTPVSEFKTEAWGDANLRQCRKGDIIQLERKGYYIVDEEYSGATSKPIRLIAIPDGKVASISSKSSEMPAEAKGGSSSGSSKKKQAGAAKQEVQGPYEPKINMYTLPPIYGKLGEIKHEAVSKMYAVDPIYGKKDLIVDLASATVESGKPSGKKAKESAVQEVNAGKVEKDATAGKQEKGAKGKRAEPAPAQQSEASIIAKLDIVVGKILEVSKHPDADSLYVEKIDCGEAEPRTVVSGLVKFMTEEEMKGKTILILKNLKPAAMRGIKSHAMVLCASNSDHTKVEFLLPPPQSKPGDRVFFRGHEGTPEEQLNPKKKVFETVQPDFITRDDLVACWKDVPFETEHGFVKAASLKGASIK
ncbi:hypothetical protein HDU96_004494 [Phlyctochytrium bullatum]|nr:hypothetical protein HDU96_004494 [Phlyctochytrium bullatum]